MKLGVHSIHFLPGPPEDHGPALSAAATAAEQAGVSVLTLAEHFLQTDHAVCDYAGQPSDPFLEGCNTPGFLAARTSTIGLGTPVTVVTFRHPRVLVKTIANLDGPQRYETTDSPTIRQQCCRMPAAAPGAPSAPSPLGRQGRSVTRFDGPASVLLSRRSPAAIAATRIRTASSNPRSH